MDSNTVCCKAACCIMFSIVLITICLNSLLEVLEDYIPYNIHINSNFLGILISTPQQLGSPNTTQLNNRGIQPSTLHKQDYKYMIDPLHPYLHIDTSLPGPHIPKHNEIPMADILAAEGPINTPCKFKGKIFCLGTQKTGTTTMKSILVDTFGYKCSHNPLITCDDTRLDPYMNDILPSAVATDDISWVIHSKPFYNDFIQSVMSSNVFADSPWYHLYPFYDQLIPSNHSKFILTVRDSTRDVLNSRLKMLIRNLIKKRNLDDNLQLDYTNASQYLHLRLYDFWMLNARNYELHNQHVIEYFTKRGRLNDLLVINLVEESKKNVNEQWYKITDFLGCPNMNGSLPKKNSAGNKQIDFFPKDFTINWENYTVFWKNMKMVFDFVRTVNGSYDERKWNRLKSFYDRSVHKKTRSNVRGESMAVAMET